MAIMEKMYDQSEIHLSSIGLNPENKSYLKSSLQDTPIVAEWLDHFDQLQVESPVVVFELNQSNSQVLPKQLFEFRKKFKSSTLVLLAKEVEIAKLADLISRYDVYSVVTPNSAIKQILTKGFEKFSEQSQYYKTLQKVKTQNKSLEGLKVNLQDLVHERTKSEFEENKQMESTVRELQSLLRFIKSVGRLETIEELMELVREEFRKIQGIMPPLLMMDDNTRSVRIFYFQGKQLIEKRVRKTGESIKLKNSDAKKLKSYLSNNLGRPFGGLELLEFKFKAEELNHFDGIMIFEELLGDKSEDPFSAFSQERWPVINMALENLLLKESLHNIAKQWARTFNEMEDPILILDQSYKMSLSNGDFHKKPNRLCYQAFAKRDTPCKDCPIGETFASGVPKASDIRVGNKIYRCHSYPIRMQGYEGASHVINQYVDVTQSIDLQSKVIQGEKMAAVGLLAGNIAHELNNPLTGIYSLSDLLLQEIEKESNLFKDLTEVKNAARRCQRIIKDLLEFTEIGEDSRAKDIDVNDLLRKTLPLLKMAMRTLNSDIELSDEPMLVKMNPQLLQQVLFNLINNACQAMEDNGYLYVTTEVDGEWVVVKIRDTGSGIPDEIAESIFDPFFTTKEEGKGTGLGLSMSKSVVERAGGKLELNNRLDVGTEFIVKLPKVKE